MDDFKHKQIDVNGISTHVVEVGDENKQPILFLHGFPEDWSAFENVMRHLKNDYSVISIDLPGIGKSEPITTSDKLSIAHFIQNLISVLKLRKVVLVGQDVGGMTAFSCLRVFPELISKAVIMNTAVPGVAPWEDVKRNPYIWHFAFFAIPELPEKVFTGKQDLLFDFFFNAITFNKQVFTEEKKKIYVEAYTSTTALKTGFDWYRAFNKDEKDNANPVSVNVPVLYLKGEKEYMDINQYIEGFKASGINNIKGEFITGSGHYAADEAPEEVAKAIDHFIKK
jgi:pimeloyl-ACP methyl ester carboxylesterase